MIALHTLETYNIQNISINNTSNINNSVMSLVNSEKVELQPGLIALVSLMAFILLIMIATLLLPKSIQDNIFQLILNQTPDQTFNYIDVGLYKTRHSIYRKEVYSLAMQGNQYKKKDEGHTLLSNNKSISSLKCKGTSQLKPMATKSVIASVSVPEDYDKFDQCSCSTSVCKSTLSSYSCHAQHDCLQMENEKSVIFSKDSCSFGSHNNDKIIGSNINNDNYNHIRYDSYTYANSRRNSTSNLTKEDFFTYDTINLLSSSLNTRYSLPVRFTQSSQSINAFNRLPLTSVSPKSKQPSMLNKRVRLQLSDNFIDRCK
ncbi:unnamed protein product [Heterobilharzia americana]|nr:unnamed protein product [Heterobilharzia americana]